MAASEEFKAQLKAGKIVDALTLALSEAVDLEITTWVSPASGNSDSDSPLPGHRLRTHINLIEGKIENEVGDQFLENGSYSELHKFHLEQVKEGRQTIQKNLESLQKMFVVLSNTLSQMPQTTSKQLQEEYPALFPTSENEED